MLFFRTLLGLRGVGFGSGPPLGLIPLDFMRRSYRLALSLKSAQKRIAAQGNHARGSFADYTALVSNFSEIDLSTDQQRWLDDWCG